jgi:hypothetical protein
VAQKAFHSTASQYLAAMTMQKLMNAQWHANLVLITLVFIHPPQMPCMFDVYAKFYMKGNKGIAD